MSGLMPKPLSAREQQVLYELVRRPSDTDKNISDRTGLKLSTITAIRHRLKAKGVFHNIRIPCPQAIGAELMAVNYSVYKATASVESRLKTGKKFAKSHKEVFWALNEYVQSVGLHFSKNYTDISSNITELEEYYTVNGYLGEEGIHLLIFPFEMVDIPYFFDFSPLLAQSFGIIEDPRKKQEKIPNGCAKSNNGDNQLSETGRLVYYSLVKHPDLTDTELSEKISVSQRTITKLRKEFEERGLMKSAIIPDLEKLGFKMLVFDHARLNMKLDQARQDRILESLIGIKPPIMLLIGHSDVVALTAYEDFETYRRSINCFSEIYKHENIFIKEPRRLMFSLTEMEMIKDHVYAPWVARILNLDEGTI